jgi:uncharacterized protein (DUF1810 family)
MSGDLKRFVDAQDPVYATAIAELRADRKRTHWMWFVFPQHRALGRSAMAIRYGIASLAEARDYAEQPVLGVRPRLRECVDVMRAAPNRISAHAMLGLLDDVKLRSSMTLLTLAVPEETKFRAALDRFYEGALDARIMELVRERAAIGGLSCAWRVVWLALNRPQAGRFVAEEASNPRPSCSTLFSLMFAAKVRTDHASDSRVDPSGRGRIHCPQP